MKSFIKKNIKFIIIVVICITCSVLTTFATDYLFNSSEVYYNNTTSGIQADKVQGAIDELYACASNYAAYNQRLTSAETTIGSGSLTTTSQNLIGAVNGLNEQIPKIISFDKTATIPNSGSVDINIANETGGIAPVGAFVKLGSNYPLPYFSGDKKTYVELLNVNNLRISGNVSGWGSQTVHITLYFA